MTWRTNGRPIVATKQELGVADLRPAVLPPFGPGLQAVPVLGTAATNAWKPGDRCPGCGRANWHVGRATAECAFCATALPLEKAA